MKYAKPSVALLATAASAIQSGQAIKRPQVVADTDLTSQFLSNGAYEADE